MQKLFKPAVFTLCLLPLLALAYAGFTNGLGANPIEKLIRDLGEWALRFLLIALAVTPLRQFTGWTKLAQLRRMLGLFAFFYVFLHLSLYLALDLSGSLTELWKDILKRPFITVGMAAFIILLPLAITSTDKMIKRLGGPRWRKLHKLVYAAGILGVLHFYWLAKADKTEPLIYAAILAVLLGYRVAEKSGLPVRLPRNRAARNAR